MSTNPPQPPSDQPLSEASPPEVPSTSEPPTPEVPSIPEPPPVTLPPNESRPPQQSTAEATPQPSKVMVAFRLVKQLVDIVVATTPIVIRVIGKFLQVLLQGLSYLRAWWLTVLPKIRARLPEPWKTQLPEPVLTAIAILSLVFVLGITTNLFADHSAPVAKTPNIEQPSKQPQPVAPDPDKIARLQNQITEITDQYSEGLLQSIRLNDRRHLLTVHLTNDWYRLSANQQNQLAEEMLKRSRKLKFDRLEFTDPEDSLVARSPVVGSEMLILERTKELPAVEPAAPEPGILEPAALTEEPDVPLPLSPEGI